MQPNIIDFIPEESAQAVEQADKAINQNEEQASKELLVISKLVPATIFQEGGADPIIDRIEREARSVVYDISTQKGRKQIASMAYEIARSKTLLDEMGKDLGDDLRKQKDAIDAERRTVRARLDALKDEIRKPLTDWENAEKARISAHENAIDLLQALAVYDPSLTSTGIAARIEVIKNHRREWQEFEMRANTTKQAALTILEEAFADTKDKEDRNAELERLLKEKADREQKEREDKIAADAAEQARKDAEHKAELAAKAVKDAADAEIARLQKEKDDADARAKKAEEDCIAAAEKAENDRIAAEVRAKAAADAAANAERNRIASEVAAQAKRNADNEHRAKINREARDDIMAALDDGYSEEDAQKIIIAIAQGNIRNVKITY